MPRKLKINRGNSEVVVPPEIYFSANDIARFLGIHVKTVYDYINQGRFGDIIRLPKGDARISATAYNDFLEMLKEEHKYANIV